MQKIHQVLGANRNHPQKVSKVQSPMRCRSSGYGWHQRNCGEHGCEVVDRCSFLQTSDPVVAKAVTTRQRLKFGRELERDKFELCHCQNICATTEKGFMQLTHTTVGRFRTPYWVDRLRHAL